MKSDSPNENKKYIISRTTELGRHNIGFQSSRSYFYPFRSAGDILRIRRNTVDTGRGHELCFCTISVFCIGVTVRAPMGIGSKLVLGGILLLILAAI